MSCGKGAKRSHVVRVLKVSGGTGAKHSFGRGAPLNILFSPY